MAYYLAAPLAGIINSSNDIDTAHFNLVRTFLFSGHNIMLWQFILTKQELILSNKVKITDIPGLCINGTESDFFVLLCLWHVSLTVGYFSSIRMCDKS